MGARISAAPVRCQAFSASSQSKKSPAIPWRVAGRMAPLPQIWTWGNGPGHHGVDVQKQGCKPPHTGSNFVTQATPREVAALGGRYYSSNLVDRALRVIDRRKNTIRTLDIPE
jgi:hypothetical protein